MMEVIGRSQAHPKISYLRKKSILKCIAALDALQTRFCKTHSAATKYSILFIAKSLVYFNKSVCMYTQKTNFLSSWKLASKAAQGKSTMKEGDTVLICSVAVGWLR